MNDRLPRRQTPCQIGRNQLWSKRTLAFIVHHFGLHQSWLCHFWPAPSLASPLGLHQIWPDVSTLVLWYYGQTHFGHTYFVNFPMNLGFLCWGLRRVDENNVFASRSGWEEGVRRCSARRAVAQKGGVWGGGRSKPGNVGTRRVGSPKCRASFLFFLGNVSLFVCSQGVFLCNFWWSCFWRQCKEFQFLKTNTKGNSIISKFFFC